MCTVMATRSRGSLPALIAVVLLAIVAMFHAYWALGGRWPGTDDASFARRVLGDTTTLPSVPATWAIVVALLGCAALLLVAVHILAIPLPARLLTIGLWLVVAGFSLRALAGLTSIPPLVRGTDVPYYKLDVAIYSPLCLLIALLVVATVRSRSQHRS